MLETSTAAYNAETAAHDVILDNPMRQINRRAHFCQIFPKIPYFAGSLMAVHSFDPEIAKIVGTNAAVIYQNISWWAEKNRANNKHFHDGKYWTYNTREAFNKLFPYLSVQQIKTAINKLVDAGLLVKGNFNEKAYDKTNWYAPLEPLVENNQGSEKALVGNNHALGQNNHALVKSNQPIPVDKPDIKPDDKKNNTKKENSIPIDENLGKIQIPEIEPPSTNLGIPPQQMQTRDESDFDRFWEVYPNAVEKRHARTAFDIAVIRCSSDNQTADDIIDGAVRYAQTVDRKFIMKPKNWLEGDRWNDRPAERVPDRPKDNSKTEAAKRFIERIENEQRSSEVPELDKLIDATANSFKP